MNKLERIIKKAIEIDAETIVIEYRDGVEEISAHSGSVGVTIDTIKSNSKESESLFAYSGPNWTPIPEQTGH